MHLSKVVVENFRSLQHMEAEFEPGLNVLVGRNNTGKTNLLHAIRHAVGPSGSRGDALWLDREDFHCAGPGAEPASEFTITLTFSCLSESQRAHFFEIVEFNLADVSKSTAILRMKATWSSKRNQVIVKRTGGAVVVDAPEVPQAILASLPITFLPALRDAEGALAPGQKSRLAMMLKDLAERRKNGDKEAIEAIFRIANENIERQELVSRTKESLLRTTRDLAGIDHIPSTIRASDVDFDRIIRTLRVQMEDVPIEALEANGLGYNNLLYMAVVLEHLKMPEADECPLLLVEEPEAHLHPQLTSLLADYLATKTPGEMSPQTLVTTHSPTMAASVPPTRVHVLYSDSQRRTKCHGLKKAGMDEKESLSLQRMMDLTRATLYFAKGVILVEGISEALLIPVLAARLGHDLRKLHISVIPIAGVAFETFKKLLDPQVLGIPVAMVTDADPSPVRKNDKWENDLPKKDGEEAFEVCGRTKKLQTLFDGHATVSVFASQVTLEYDLAAAGDTNADIMAMAWEGCFKGNPETFNRSKVEQAGAALDDKALVAWRGICRASPAIGKAEFTHRLSAMLVGEDGSNCCPVNFDVPGYLKRAIEHVVTGVGSPPKVGAAL